MQVITTLERAVDCSHKEAIDFATTVDREVSISHMQFYITCLWFYNGTVDIVDHTVLKDGVNEFV